MKFDVAKFLTKKVISLDNSINYLDTVHGVLVHSAQLSVNLKFDRILSSIERTMYNPEDR